MTTTSIIRDAIAALYSDVPDAEQNAQIIWKLLEPVEREVLRQLLFQGPVGDGNIISKRARDNLISYELACRCCFMGEQGYTAATYPAVVLLRNGLAVPMPKKPGSPG